MLPSGYSPVVADPSMPISNQQGHGNLMQFLGRFVPPVARGLALGFAVLAVATAVFGMGDYATTANRYVVSGVYALVAVVSLAISRLVKPTLRRMPGED
jgi:hypothetical protein